MLGASNALADHLARRPADCDILNDPELGVTRPTAEAMRVAMLASVGGDVSSSSPSATVEGPVALDAMRVEYRRLLLRVAARDLTTSPDVSDIAAELADLAAAALEAAAAVARAEVGDDSAGVRFAIIAMGRAVDVNSTT